MSIAYAKRSHCRAKEKVEANLEAIDHAFPKCTWMNTGSEWYAEFQKYAAGAGIIPILFFVVCSLLFVQVCVACVYVQSIFY